MTTRSSLADALLSVVLPLAAGMNAFLLGTFAISHAAGALVFDNPIVSASLLTGIPAMLVMLGRPGQLTVGPQQGLAHAWLPRGLQQRTRRTGLRWAGLVVGPALVLATVLTRPENFPLARAVGTGLLFVPIAAATPMLTRLLWGDRFQGGVMANPSPAAAGLVFYGLATGLVALATLVLSPLAITMTISALSAAIWAWGGPRFLTPGLRWTLPSFSSAPRTPPATPERGALGIARRNIVQFTAIMVGIALVCRLVGTVDSHLGDVARYTARAMLPMLGLLGGLHWLMPHHNPLPIGGTTRARLLLIERAANLFLVVVLGTVLWDVPFRPLHLLALAAVMALDALFVMRTWMPLRSEGSRVAGALVSGAAILGTGIPAVIAPFQAALSTPESDTTRWFETPLYPLPGVDLLEPVLVAALVLGVLSALVAPLLNRRLTPGLVR